MKIERSGAKHFEGWRTIADRPMVDITRDPGAKTVTVFVKWARGGQPGCIFNYRLTLSTYEVERLAREILPWSG